MIKKASEWIRLNSPALMAFFLSVLSFLYFLTISNKLSFLGNGGFLTQRYFAIFLILIYFISGFCYLFYQKYSQKRLLSYYFESTVIGLFSMLYFTTINRQILLISQIGQKWLIFDTGLVMVPLTALVFFTNLFLFTRQGFRNWLVSIQSFLIIVFCYSFVDLLINDRTNIRNFTNRKNYIN
jgi:hypothetical protein